MKSGIRLVKHGKDWVATECEPQGKDTYVRVLGWFNTLDEALQEFPGAEVQDDTPVRT